MSTHRPPADKRLREFLRTQCRFVATVATGIGVGVACLITGCESRQPRSASTTTQAVESSSSEDLIAAVNYVTTWEQIDPSTATQDTMYHLNRWSESQTGNDKWKADPLIERLPRNLRRVINVEKILASESFFPSDLTHLRQAYWMREVANRIARQTDASDALDWLPKSPPLPRADAERLALALRLFDWTIRNIQLDPLPPYPPDATVGPTAEPAGPATSKNKSSTSGDAASLPAAARGLAGPGYRREPWQTLLVGHGDAWERARVFAALARQHDLETVMLAIDDPQSNRPAHAWLPALLLGGQLYLFDTTLGLPLPLTPSGTVATLEQLIKSPEILERLSIDDKQRYSVRKEDLEHIVAFIDAGPWELSRRASLAEASLTGDHQLVLAVNPTELAGKLKGLSGVSKVLPWHVPWEAMLYQAALHSPGNLALRSLPELVELQMLGGPHPLAKGRNRHVRGLFDKTDSDLGAKNYYLDSRMPDKLIEQLPRDQALQQRMGLFRTERDDDANWGRRVAIVQEFCLQAKSRSGYWLGLVQYETANYSVAADWFQNRTLQAAPKGPWTGSATYNLARSYEMQGQFDKARETLYRDESPQKLGNHLRARLLAERPTEKPAGQ